MSKNLKNKFDILKKTPLIFVVSGPSGVGKDTIVNELKDRSADFHFVVTANTREPRPGEVEGVDYFFVSREEFQRMIDNNELIEWAYVYDDFKGVPRAQIDQALASGKDVLMRLDVQGAKTIKNLYPHAKLIFLLPTDEEEWKRRITARANEQGEDVDLDVRVNTVIEEIDSLEIFDYAVVNADGKLDEAIDVILSIVQTEHHKINN
jgi:guanylate kinase